MLAKYLLAQFSARSCLPWLCIQQMLVGLPLMMAKARHELVVLNVGAKRTPVVITFMVYSLT